MAAAVRSKHSKLDHVSINQGLTVVYPDPDLPKKSSSDEINVDIVAVPGLGANPEFTWRTNKVDWLRDSNMLPRYVEKARIMVFEYESQWFGKGSINQRLSTVADQLLQALLHQRPRGSKRPIVFVCHCLGGIIVEKALLGAQLRQNDYPNVFMSVVGCIFLGTPFRGTKSQNKASLLADMAESVGLGSNSGLLKLLEQGSETLKDLLSDFSALAREVNMQLFCFFEQHESNITNLAIKSSHLKHNELIVEEDSAHIDGYRTGALAADHFGLNKFSGPKDGRYISVAGEINAAVQKAGGILKSRQNAIRQSLIDDATYQTILDGLKATDPQKDLQDSVRGRSVSQASWALANENYLTWKNSKVSDALWIHGGAGKGQPVIASSILNELEQETKGQEGAFAAYFFCDEKDSHRRSVRDILKLFICQMILKNRNLTEYLLTDSDKGKTSSRNPQGIDEETSLATLWRSLQSILSDGSVDRVCFLINAFDETDRDSRKEFLGLLAPLLEPKAATEGAADRASVKWIFLSRSGRPDIEKAFQDTLVICTEDKANAAFVNDGVKKEISDQVDELARVKRYNKGLIYLIKRYIIAKADGNYIYASLVVQELKNIDPAHASISSIRKLLEDFPYGLTDMFEFIRHRVLSPQSEGIEYTKEILRCLIIAEESPTLTELALMADLPSEVRHDEVAVRRYIRRCGAFITTTEEDGDAVVEWIDVAAKEHLTTYAKDELSLTQNDVQHGIVALRCLEHLRNVFAPISAEPNDVGVREDEESLTTGSAKDETEPEPDHENDQKSLANESLAGDPSSPHQDKGNFDRAHDDIASLPHLPDTSQDKAISDKVQSHESQNDHDPEPSLEYAVLHWIEHAIQAPEDVVEELDFDDEFWSEDSVARANWWKEYSAESRYAGVTDLTPLHLAALTGWSPLLNFILENGHTDGLHKVDSWGYTPLAWAADHGDLGAVDRLLKAGADINQTSAAEGPTALGAAASCGHMEIVQYLIEQGADVDVPNESLGSPLYLATSDGSPEIVRELLQHGANVNLKGGWHIRPLNVAAYSGYADRVRMLLEQGADVDPDDDYRYGSALGAAARRGHVEIIHDLLQKGWNVNRKLKTYNSPIVAAATYGHAEVVQALLQHQIEGASQVQALEIASKNGRTEVVRHLLEGKSNLPHQKAFHYAAMNGRDEIVELLEKRGTNPEMLGMALYDASDQERESTVRILLDLGASPDAEGKEYGNALQAASYDGSTGIVESLLAHNANVNKYGGDYGSALQAAAVYGHKDVVQMLLERGACVNTQSIGRYGSALQAASWSGHADLVELLIAHGADVNSTGGIYGSPIMAAVDQSMFQTLEILVKHGADVNVKDVRDEKPTLLVQAGYTLGKESLELLLDHGADIEGTDDHGVTVLISVADSGDKESLEMLLERGANIHAVSKFLGTALSAAASEGDEESCKVLLDHGADANQVTGDWGTALQAAADAADLDCINLLLAAGADVNQISTGYGCALQAAASSGNIDCLQRLLEVGAEVNTAAGEFGSPLEAAAFGGHLECMQALLDRGADVQVEGGTYQSPLQAAAAKQDNYDCVKMLLDHGASVFTYGGLYGSTIQAVATGQNHEVLDLVLERGADVHVKGGKFGSVLQAAALKAGKAFVQRLLEQNVEVNEIGGKYGTALQAAAFANDSEVVTTLLENNANPQFEGGLYGNALNAAACRGNIDVLNLLLNNALPVEILDGALIQAVYHRQESATELLLKKGASVEARDELLGSVLNALQKDPPTDSNSDDEDVESEDEEASDSESDDEEEEEDSSEEDDGSSSGNTNDQESVIDLQIDDSTSVESKIQKLLDDARSKIRRNPTLRRPPTVKRKPVSPFHQNGQALGIQSQQDAAQKSLAVSGAYQGLNDRWRASQPQNTYVTQAGAYGEPTTTAPASSGYAAYSNRPPIPQHYNSYQQQPSTSLSSGRPQLNDASRIQTHGSPPQSQYHNVAQQPPPLPPKSDILDYSNQTPSAPQYQAQFYQNQYNAPTPPPPKPPRPAPDYTNYQAYTPNTQSTSYQPQQPSYQAQQYPNSSGGSPQMSGYAPYQAPAQTPPYAANPSSANAPPFPPRPGPSTNQSAESLDFTRLQEKASKFGASMGKFWK